MHEEIRVQKRRNSIYHLKIYDSETGEFMGRLVDMTAKGIKMVSENPLPLSRVYQLQVDLPAGYFMQSTFSFEGKSMWCKKDVNPDYYVTGFFAPGLETANQDIVANLINHLSFND